MIPPKRFDIFSLTGGCFEGLGAFDFSLDTEARVHAEPKYNLIMLHNLELNTCIVFGIGFKY